MKVLHSNQKQTIRYFAFIMLFMATLAMGCSNNEEFDSLNPESENPVEKLLTKADFNTDAFVTEWLVPKDSVVTLPIDTNYQYNCIIDWGDDSELSYIITPQLNENKHKYLQTGAYRIKILGHFPALKWDYRDNSYKYLIKIVQWGKVHFKTFKDAFFKCTKLTTIPANIPNIEDYSGIFSNCEKLASIPDNLFSNCTKAINFDYAFYGCVNLQSLPPDLFADCYNAKTFNSTFMAVKIENLPCGLFKNCHAAENFTMTFALTNLVNLPADLFYDCTDALYFINTFFYCSSLTTIPESLFDQCKNVIDFGGTFCWCSSLSGKTPKTGTLELWDRAGNIGYPEIINGDSCFAGTKYDLSLIPKEWGGTLER